ncbi:MAG TPA: hypothetical protein VJT71_16135 [Pyrinomonadaceae bacterium]|nr:hypothetical protein [Pyrinomonadaceae bacterium]
MPFPIDELTRDMIKSHFRRKNLVWTEDYFLAALESSQKYDVYWATIALRDCGTTRCVDALKAKLNYPMKDVSCTAILTIAHIARESETPFYAQALLSPIYKEKTYAMWAIQDAADARAVPPVLAYFKKNRAKLLRGKLINATLADGIEYLHRYRVGNPDVTKFFEEVRNAWSALAAGERSEILKRVPNFMGDNAAQQIVGRDPR